MRAFVAALLLASLLPGCSGLDGPELMTAREALPVADRSAQRWADDAQLVSVSGIEADGAARREMADEISDAREEVDEAYRDGELNRTERDEVTAILRVYDRVASAGSDKPGDGRAAVWFFTYVSQELDQARSVAVARGAVVHSDESEPGEFDADDAEPLGDWGIDSTDAASAAGIGNADYTALCAATNVMSFHELESARGRPLWLVGIQSMAEDPSGPDDAFAAVDAVNGSLVQDEVPLGPGDFEDLLLTESGTVGGQFIASVLAHGTGAFEVEDDRHEAVMVHVSMSPPPLQQATFTITDPQGTATTLTLDPQATGFRAERAGLLPQAVAGEYTVGVDVSVAPRHSWSVAWCTDGLPVDQDDVENPACMVLWEQEGNASGDAAAGALGQRLGETLSAAHRWLGAW